MALGLETIRRRRAARAASASTLRVEGSLLGRNLHRTLGDVELAISGWEADPGGGFVGFTLDARGGAVAVNVKSGSSLYPASAGSWQSPQGRAISSILINIGDDDHTIINLPDPGLLPGSEASVLASD